GTPPDAGKFNLLVNNIAVTPPGGVGNGGFGQIFATSGNNTIAETAAAGTFLSNYNSTILCKTELGVTLFNGAGPGPADLNIPAGGGATSHVLCTVTNTVKNAAGAAIVTSGATTPGSDGAVLVPLGSTAPDLASLALDQLAGTFLPKKPILLS